jgi:hypothetical protein
MFAIPVRAQTGRASDAPAASPNPPASGSPEALSQARALFERGVQLSAQERWGEALDYFQRSRALAERPNTVFNLASTMMRLGRLIDARAALRDYIRLANSTHDDASRADAERMLGTVNNAIGTLALAVTPPEAEVRIDGRLAPGDGAARALELDPGAHTLTVAGRGYITSTVNVSIGQAERQSRAVTLAPVTSTGAITVQVSPATAVVRIDGRAVGVGSYSGEIAPGSHVVEVTADGYDPTRRQVLIARGDNMVVHASLSHHSSILTSPALWGTVGAVVVVGAVAAILGVVLTPPTYERGNTGTIITAP